MPCSTRDVVMPNGAVAHLREDITPDCMRRVLAELRDDVAGTRSATPSPALSDEDLFLIAAALRHERAQRLWKASKNGHRAKAIPQLLRLERLFDHLARAWRDKRDRTAAGRFRRG